MIKQMKLHGKGRDTLVDYISLEGERIKVVSGPIVRKIVYSNSNSNKTYHKRRFSTRIYVDGEKYVEYSPSDLAMEDIPLVREKLSELESAEATAEEVLQELENIVRACIEERGNQFRKNARENAIKMLEV